jgi:Asp-tRNA(Asn)/Glu-tRNA(Gln) amidotransferase A subunit family amidase
VTAFISVVKMTPVIDANSVQDLREQLAAGSISPRSVAEQALTRANSNASQNVYISLDAGRVLSNAAELPDRFASNRAALLYGLPISLKDCFDLKGFPTSCGSRYYAAQNGIAGADSAVATRLCSQGAVIVGKAHLHQLAYGITGENPDYGDCVQPRDPSRLTGGSSSGGAAGVQEGSAIAAIGTDTGGSIRVPAALCGLAGYRASIELAHQCGLWRGGIHLAPSFDTLGWLFRDLRDAPLLAEALFDLRVPPAPQMKVRIGSVHQDFLHDCDAEILAGFAKWKNEMSERGATISTIDSQFWEGAIDIFAPIQAHEAAAIHTAATGADFSHFERSIAERLAWGASLPPAEIEVLRQRHAEFRERMDALLREYDFLVAPCAPVHQLVAGADHRNTRRTMLRYTVPGSLAGVPIVTLPTNTGAGVQLMAARGADARLLAYAAELVN